MWIGKEGREEKGKRSEAGCDEQVLTNMDGDDGEKEELLPRHSGMRLAGIQGCAGVDSG